MMRLLLCAIVAWLAWPAAAAEYNRVELAASSIQFISKQMGVPVQGGFGKFTAQVNFDPAKPEAARARVEIDMASIDAGSREANQEVIGKNWFAVKEFPLARFESTSLTPLGGDRYQVRGKLTLRNVTREVSAPFSFRGGVFEGRFIVKRLDYGIGQGVWADVGTVADDVEVRFKFLTLPSK
ncbi:MAG: hypothetical protein RIR70_153 [Pseudomonadota bacterium]|jgi:polyisoprenoid-binding protein YceI